MYASQLTDLGRSSELKNLKWLCLNVTQGSDLSPLAGLKTLEWLHIYGEPASDLTPLAGLSNLQELYLHDGPLLVAFSKRPRLRGTQSSDLSPIGGLKNLRRLHLDVAPDCDLSPLAGLKNLNSLCTGDAPVSDLSPLAELEDFESGLTSTAGMSAIFRRWPSLRTCISLTSTALVSDLSALPDSRTCESCTSARRPSGTSRRCGGLKYLLRLYLNGRHVSDLSPLAELKNLQELDFQGSFPLHDERIQRLHKVLPFCEIY